ncbi:MAG TPA: YgjP-like metallopeptidase domain-containing protein, partial [Gammaproteobacteria bacterium]|nr:YgjP-like metallopeptidase domain-containing protein [Gammaproteobacteria bacterium]
RRWIERARQEIASRHRAGSERLPSSIELAAVGQTWNVCYLHVRTTRPACRAIENALEVRTPDREFNGARALLRAWLVGQAKACLSPWLIREAESIGRRPKSVQIRLQRTRWGSCSGTGNISLNASLLFVEPSLVRYLLIHELCHLFSLNHSRRFWSAVEQFEPDHRALDRRLTEAWALVPLWVHEP